MADGVTAKQLREERAPLANRIKEMVDVLHQEQRDFTAEELPNWEQLNADYNSLSLRIERTERVERVIADQEEVRSEQFVAAGTLQRLPGRPDINYRDEHEKEERKEEENRNAQPTEEDKAFALQAWLRAGAHKDLEERHRKAAAKCNIRPYAPAFEFSLRRDLNAMRSEFRALSAIQGTAGGFTVPEGFVNNLERAMLQFGGMRQVAEIMRTASGNEMPWPTTNDTSNKGELLGENKTVNEQDITFGQVVFYAHKYSSKQVKVPVELLEDSAFDLASTVGSMLGERLGRITNDHFTTGSGASQPRGIVTAAVVGKTAASATAITMDEVLDLIHSVDPAYRMGGGVMMHDNVLLVIRKLKDGNGNYLWTAGTQAGEPDRIWGYPLTINQSMASSVASSNKTILFGQLSKYKVRDVASVRLVRLNERYADADQVGFLAFSRHDGNLLDAGTNPVKVLQQA